MNAPRLDPLPPVNLEFSDHEVERYSRNIILPEFGAEGQAKLRASTVLCIGAGGLGSPAILYLAAAGVGRLLIADGDRVDASNLQRQVAHTTAGIGQLKAESAAAAAKALNPLIDAVAIPQRLDAESLPQWVGQASLVLDGSDNFATRYLVNDACRMARVPLVSASVFRFEGQLTSFLQQPKTPCYRCLYPKAPPAGSVPSCSEAGVLGPAVGVLGTMQALEAIRLIAGVGEPLFGRLLRFDGLSMSMLEFGYGRRSDCALCGDAPMILELREEASGPDGCSVA